jgi:hypothetical protein
LPIVRAEKNHKPLADLGDIVEVFLEIATDSVDLDARILLEDRRAGRPQHSASTSNGMNRRSDPLSRSALSSIRVFSEVPLPSSTRVSGARCCGYRR